MRDETDDERIDRLIEVMRLYADRIGHVNAPVMIYNGDFADAADALEELRGRAEAAEEALDEIRLTAHGGVPLA